MIGRAAGWASGVGVGRLGEEMQVVDFYFGASRLHKTQHHPPAD